MLQIMTSRKIVCATFEDFVAKSRHLRQGYVIASHSIQWDAITYSSLRYLLLATKSSFILSLGEVIIV